jgi:SAM-dependent methyltransferase
MQSRGQVSWGGWLCFCGGADNRIDFAGSSKEHAVSNNRWDDHFRHEHYVYGEAPNGFLTEQVSRLPPGGKVLCLASGEGRNAVYLASLGFQVTAIDGSEVGMSKARRLAEKRGVALEMLVSDLCDYELLPRSWDAVVALWCHLSSAFRPTVHHRIERGLRRGGVVLIEDDHSQQVRDGAGQLSGSDRLSWLEELRESFTRLEELHAFEGERDVQEGHGCGGPRYVTQYIARKTRR